jgi:hypothetical protein
MSAYDFALVFARPCPRQSLVPLPHLLLNHAFTLLPTRSFISPLIHMPPLLLAFS